MLINNKNGGHFLMQIMIGALWDMGYFLWEHQKTIFPRLYITYGILSLYGESLSVYRG